MRRYTHPGEILREDFFKHLGLTQNQLAKKLGHDIKVVNRLLNEKTSVTPRMALRLGKLLNTTPEFWMNAQVAYDLYLERKKVRDR